MGIKMLFSFLAVVIGISMSGYFIGSVAMGHEYQIAYAPTVSLVMFYFALFAGVAITILGCILSCTKKKDITLTIALITVLGLAIIFQIVAISTIQNYLGRESGFVMIILIVANAAILTLANIYLVQTLLDKGEQINGN